MPNKKRPATEAAPSELTATTPSVRRASTDGHVPVAPRRGRKIAPDDLARRIQVFEQQEREGFTNQDAARRAAMGLPAWNQWKQKFRRERDEEVLVPHPPGEVSPASSAGPERSVARSARPPGDVAELVRLRSRVAELEALFEGLRALLDQYVPRSDRT